MIRLLELTPEERACLQSMQPSIALQALVERMRQHLLATLGAKVTVCNVLSGTPRGLLVNGEPHVAIENELAAAWLDVRYGGKGGKRVWGFRDQDLMAPLVALVRRSLAQTVINLGEDAEWPQSMRIQMNIGGQQGNLEIIWNSEQAFSWARRAIREKS